VVFHVIFWLGNVVEHKAHNCYRTAKVPSEWTWMKEILALTLSDVDLPPVENVVPVKRTIPDEDKIHEATEQLKKHRRY
jgi:hypothetical protein